MSAGKRIDGNEKARRRGCPDNRALADAFMTEMSPHRTAGVRAHAETCVRCRSKLETLALLRSELEARRHLVPENLTRDERRAWLRLAAEHAGAPRRAGVALRLLKPAWIAATACFLLAAGYLAFNRLSRPVIVRGDPSSGIEIVRPSGLLSEAPHDLVWMPIPGADTYEISIATDAFETIFIRSTLSAAPFSLPEEIRRNLKPGVTYLLTVIAADDLSRRLGTGHTLFKLR